MKDVLAKGMLTKSPLSMPDEPPFAAPSTEMLKGPAPHLDARISRHNEIQAKRDATNALKYLESKSENLALSLPYSSPNRKKCHESRNDVESGRDAGATHGVARVQKGSTFSAPAQNYVI